MRIRAIQNQTAGATDAPSPPAQEVSDPSVAQGYVTEMDLLFSGTRNLQHLREEHPLEPLQIPGFQSNILSHFPVLGNSSQEIGAIISRYQLLRSNLIDRRSNYTHALEGFLQPDEAFDIYQRIDQIDGALLKLDQELDKANVKKRNVEAQEVEAAREALVNEGN